MHRNGQIEGALEYFGQVDAQNLGERGCTRIFLSRMFAEFSKQGCAITCRSSRYIEFKGKEGALFHRILCLCFFGKK